MLGKDNSMWRSRIAVICHCRYFCAHRGGHGSPLFVIAVFAVIFHSGYFSAHRGGHGSPLFVIAVCLFFLLLFVLIVAVMDRRYLLLLEIILSASILVPNR